MWCCVDQLGPLDSRPVSLLALAVEKLIATWKSFGASYYTSVGLQMSQSRPIQTYDIHRQPYDIKPPLQLREGLACISHSTVVLCI